MGISILIAKHRSSARAIVESTAARNAHTSFIQEEATKTSMRLRRAFPLRSNVVAEKLTERFGISLADPKQPPGIARFAPCRRGRACSRRVPNFAARGVVYYR